MASSGDVTINEAGVKELCGHIAGYAVASRELEKYLDKHLCDEDARKAVASIPRIARQWDDLSGWRLREVKRLGPIFDRTSYAVARIAADFLGRDIEIAATFPDGLIDGENPVSRGMRGEDGVSKTVPHWAVSTEVRG